MTTTRTLVAIRDDQPLDEENLLHAARGPIA